MSTPSLFTGLKGVEPSRAARPPRRRKRDARGNPRKAAERAYLYIEHRMMDALESLFLDDSAKHLARRYGLSDAELVLLLGDLQMVFFPGHYDDPRLRGEGLVPTMAGDVGGEGRLVLAAGAVPRGPRFDAAADARVRAAVKADMLLRVATQGPLKDPQAARREG